MNSIFRTFLITALNAFLCSPVALHAASIDAESWSSSSAQHAYGFPETKPNAKGTLTVTHDSLTFTSKSSNTTIDRSSIIAVSAGNQRVELWGMKGRLLRMAIPYGGGLAAAGVMHHQVDMLTVEFRDRRGGYRSAVFLLPANEADRALRGFDQAPGVHREPLDTVCTGTTVKPGSVLVSAPTWDRAEVPAAYRALVYEHLIDRLQRIEGIGHVYRDGESDAQPGCPQFSVKIAIAGFREGSQVKRAVMGPLGMFAQTTQMSFDATFTDASGRLNSIEQVKTTVRGESESTNVADGVAKTLAKHYSSAIKKLEKPTLAGAPEAPRVR